MSWEEEEGLNNGQMALPSPHTLSVRLVTTSLWAAANAITMVELQASLLTLALLQAWIVPSLCLNLLLGGPNKRSCRQNLLLYVVGFLAEGSYFLLLCPV